MPRLLIFLCFFSFIYHSVFSQDLEVLFRSDTCKTSFYDILKINENEFWVCGKNGYLIRIDTMGKMESIPFIDPDFEIYKMAKSGNTVWFGGNSSALYCYSFNTNQFQKHEIGKEFSKKCFYDMVVGVNGSLLLCGGNSRIPQKEKVIPRGFIASFDPVSMEKPEILWKNNRSFVWSIVKNDTTQELYASAFFIPSLHSKIYKSTDGADFIKTATVKALVHSLETYDSDLIFSGTKGLKFQSKSILGKVEDNHLTYEKSENGCIFCIIQKDDQVFGCSHSGTIIKSGVKTLDSNNFPKEDLPLYEIAELTSKKLLVVGSSGVILILKN